MSVPGQRARKLLPILGVGILAAFADCDVTDPFPHTRATFSLRLAGALDTLVENGLGRWTDYPTASNGAASHQVVLWAEPRPGTSRAARVLVAVTRQPPVAPLANGVELGDAARLQLSGSLFLECPAGDAGGRCAGVLQSREGGPRPSLRLTRVEPDTISGRAQFVAVGRLPDTPRTAGAPPDTVAVDVEFTVARNPE